MASLYIKVWRGKSKLPLYGQKCVARAIEKALTESRHPRMRGFVGGITAGNTVSEDKTFTVLSLSADLPVDIVQKTLRSMGVKSRKLNYREMKKLKI